MEGGEPAEAEGDLVHRVQLGLTRHPQPCAGQDILEEQELEGELRLELEPKEYLT